MLFVDNIVRILRYTTDPMLRGISNVSAFSIFLRVKDCGRERDELRKCAALPGKGTFVSKKRVQLGIRSRADRIATPLILLCIVFLRLSLAEF